MTVLHSHRNKGTPSTNTGMGQGLEAIEASLEILAKGVVGTIEIDFAKTQTILHSRDPEILQRCAAIYEKEGSTSSLRIAKELYSSAGRFDPSSAECRMGEARCMLRDPTVDHGTIVSLLRPVFMTVKDPVEMATLLLPLYKAAPENKDLKAFFGSKHLGQAVDKQSFFDAVSDYTKGQSSILREVQEASKQLRSGGDGVIGFEGEKGILARSTVENIVLLERSPVNRTTHRVAGNKDLQEVAPPSLRDSVNADSIELGAK